jgi:hypothetical protein
MSQSWSLFSSATLTPGSYRTRNGSYATAWERGEREGAVFFIGRVEGGRIIEWTAHGTEAGGHAAWDLIEREEQERPREKANTEGGATP